MREEQIMAKARELGFADVGFTNAEPFSGQEEILAQRHEEYAWTKARGLNLTGNIDPRHSLPEARSIIVLLELYFHQAFPHELESFFGRCYLDDDRVTKDGLAVRIKAMRSFLEDGGMKVAIPFHLPQRPAAARAGLGDYGKNCLFYAKNCARGGSWVLPVALVVDAELTPGEPSMTVGCPDWCKNVCLSACPTGALKGPRFLDPRRCISYLTYFGQGLTPLEMREPMGLYVYGCDRCQNVCPRNAPWLAAGLEPNPRATAKAADFDLVKLLAMDVAYFKQRIWPNMFYMSEKELWRWHMNVARVMGNTRDEAYVPALTQALDENPDERARAMSAWALGRIGGSQARRALEARRAQESEVVAQEVEGALGMLG